MALFSRASLNAFSWLNRCYCKKFMLGTSRLRSRSHVSVLSTNVQHRDNKQSGETTLETEITRRRSQACRSLLIQVHSSKSHNDLYNYCSQFGRILSMHHYQINNRHNYILIEFQDVRAINEAMSFASFANEDLAAPVKSSVLWFRKGQGVAQQRNNQKRVSLSVDHGCSLPSDREIAKLLCNAKSTSAQMIVLYEALKLTDLEVRLRFHTAHHLEQYFSRLFQNMKVLPFGSSINGFGRKRCDLDLVLVPDNSEERKAASRLVFHSKSMEYKDRNETKQFLAILANTMQYFIPGVLNVRKILEARVPIIKFHYDYTHTECDLSATNMTAIYMTELLNLYGEIDWRVRPLVIAIRVWAKCQNITSDAPGQWITNFPLTLLVLFYLQQKKILPSLKTLKMHATRTDIRCTNNGIDCTFLRDINKLPIDYKYKPNQDSLETLLHGFFEYYSTFDFQTKGICIREGVEIRKPSRSPLHITNPLETTLNVCKNVTPHEVNHIITKSHDAIYTLETADKSNSINWGIMALLKIHNDTINLNKLNGMEEKAMKEYSENHSYGVSDKLEVNEDNIDEAKTQKTETV
ncbi:PREDICTED: poly(A) RNA polymerase, mitochondrial [Vollenhovia emeryi]|uniref:poly(A) RNA polymerase, mitochondrial n=1 Tax=Vollenhovia emeryi TaxID=411798 RepID=UPI0005F3F82F|nr:PREDICTED: poly(A) RNA polymerase, mitochondrial [Vollenhovia emeryi]